ncbi:MAG: type II toxin-antitoxin system VapC family toxin [Polyangia bacterium]
MKALDTNILVRLLLDDDPAQSKTVRRLFQTAEQNRSKLLVCDLVVLELIWVLEAVYGCTRDEVVSALESLLSLAVLEFEHADRLRELGLLARQEKTELADLLLGIAGRHAGGETTLTFDKRASRSELFAAASSG